ncbi:type 1 fimbrial protein [Leclercia sp. 29361]|nr:MULTISPECIES: fimbrial protein [unclassified Leclercia]QIK14984.1 type 1 fimbrial protein [Leclercia sp. 29361]
MTGLKKIALAFTVVALPYSALAAPTVTFEGEVTDQTCSVNINGQTSSVVMLPTVAATEFGTTLANGQTAGLTPFTISLSGCKSSTSSTNITTKFLGYDVDSTTGTLGNRATTDAATGYGIQLTSSGTGGTPVVLSGVTSVPGLVLAANATTASYEFGAQYYVVDATTAAPGKISAVAEYTVSYL